MSDPAFDLTDQFWSRTAEGPPSADGINCLNWIGAKMAAGYGGFRRAGKTAYAHRLAWEFYYQSAIPARLFVLHRCDNPSCVRKEHLFIGTHADNMKDMVAKRRHSSISKPERIARGARHRSRTSPHTLVRGERVNTAKLTPQDVLDIRRRYHPMARYRHPGGESSGQLAEEFGVGRGQIHRIITRKAWNHI